MKIDWHMVTLNLKTHYKSLQAISRELNASYDTIKELYTGRSTNPRYNLAVALLDLHFDKCRNLHKREIIGGY